MRFGNPHIVDSVAEEQQAYQMWLQQKNSLDSTPESDDPFTGLIKRELRKIIRKSRMTEYQSIAFRWSIVYQLSIRQIAEAMQISPSMAQKHLRAAISKASSCKHVGVLTVMVEEFGWEIVSQALNE